MCRCIGNNSSDGRRLTIDDRAVRPITYYAVYVTQFTDKSPANSTPVAAINPRVLRAPTVHVRPFVFCF